MKAHKLSLCIFILCCSKRIEIKIVHDWKLVYWFFFALFSTSFSISILYGEISVPIFVFFTMSESLYNRKDRLKKSELLVHLGCSCSLFMRLFLFYLFNTARNRLSKKYNFKTMLRFNSFFFEETLQIATTGKGWDKPFFRISTPDPSLFRVSSASLEKAAWWPG